MISQLDKSNLGLPPISPALVLYTRFSNSLIAFLLRGWFTALQRVIQSSRILSMRFLEMMRPKGLSSLRKKVKNDMLRLIRLVRYLHSHVVFYAKQTHNGLIKPRFNEERKVLESTGGNDRLSTPKLVEKSRFFRCCSGFGVEVPGRIGGSVIVHFLSKPILKAAKR